MFRIRIRIGSGFNWDSGSGSKQAKIVPQKRKKGRNLIHEEHESFEFCRGLRTYVRWLLIYKKNFPIVQFYKFVITNLGLDPDSDWTWIQQQRGSRSISGFS